MDAGGLIGLALLSILLAVAGVAIAAYFQRRRSAQRPAPPAADSDPWSATIARAAAEAERASADTIPREMLSREALVGRDRTFDPTAWDDSPDGFESDDAGDDAAADEPVDDAAPPSRLDASFFDQLRQKRDQA